MESGQRVGDRFVIEHAVAVGGMGTVYRARDLHTGEVVALKVLRPSAPQARFENEARVLAELDHPGIVRYVAHGMDEPSGSPYLAMEWLAGEDLDARLDRGPTTLAEALLLGRRVAEALAVAHDHGIVHRDLKPANLLLPAGDIAQVKVVDFGIALRPTAVRSTQTGIAVGTLGYMAPEQVRAAKTIDGRADLFALGCVLFECVTGQRVFPGEDPMAVLAKIMFATVPRPSELRPDVPPALDELIARLLAKKAAGRPGDAREVAGQLAAIADEGASRAPVPALPGGQRREPAALSDDEQRLIAVVVVAASHDAADAATFVMGEPPTSRFAAAIEVGRAFGVAAEHLLDGSIVLSMPGTGAATDQAARAAACALTLSAAVPEAQVGLATGRAVLAERLPFGEAIDRAARLARLGHPRPRGVRVDWVTGGLLDERFERFQDGSEIVLVGRREVDEVRTLLHQSTPCVGREAELATLQRLCAQSVAEPRATAVVVTGPAGAGKSRLRWELVRALRAGPGAVEVWRANGDPIGAGGARSLAAQAVRRAAGILEGEPLTARQDKLRARVALHVPPPQVRRVAAFVGEMVGAPFPDEENLPLRAARRDALLMGDQIRRAWVDLIDAETAARPLLLVLEDLHWGDRPTVELVDTVLRLLPTRPLIVLALARPEVDARFGELWNERGTVRLSLPPLGRAAAAQLVRSVLGDRVEASSVERIVEHAAGNAFYLEELIRSEAEGRGERLPDTVLAMVQARLEAQEPEARLLLRAASVFGQVFWEGGAQRLTHARGEAEDTTRILDELVRRELLSRSGESRFIGQTEYAFRHALVREAAYGMLTDADRRLGHRLAAQWLEQVGESDPIVLAEHYERGGKVAEAVHAYARAAHRALLANDFEAAIARAGRGITAGAQGELAGELRLVQAEAHSWRGETAQSATCASEAMFLLPAASDAWADAFARLASACFHTGDVDRLVALARDLLDRVRRGLASAGSVRSAAAATTLLYYAARLELASELLEAIESIGELPRPHPLARAFLLRARAQRAMHAGHHAEHLELLTASTACHDEAGNERDACALRCEMGYSLVELGAYAEAEALFREGLSSANRIGLKRVGWVANLNLGMVLRRLGRLTEGIARLRDSTEQLRTKGERRLEGLARTYLAGALADAGEWAGAEREARRAIALLEIAPLLLPFAHATLAEVLLGAGRAAEALPAAREAERALATLGGSLPEGEGLVRVVLAEALAATGARDEARLAIARARERLIARAEAIESEPWRRSFLQNVREHARTLALAAAES